jgi:hypothetical protein
MAKFVEPTSKDVESAFEEIQGLQKLISECVTQLSFKMEILLHKFPELEQALLSRDYWTLNSHLGSLSKIRHILDAEVTPSSSISLLASARHIFEIKVWLWLIFSNPDYALLFYRQALVNRIEHNKAALAKFRWEVEFFQELAKEEKENGERIAASVNSIDDVSVAENYIKEFHRLNAQLDDKARRKFCLYAKMARTNGYSYQAHLVQTHTIPEYEGRGEKSGAELQVLDAFIAAEPSTFLGDEAKKRWNWKDRALQTGMGMEYDFLYSYTSKLLHATPMSIVTQPELSNSERLIFLEYIYISIRDIVDLVEGIGVLHNVAFIQMDGGSEAEA